MADTDTIILKLQGAEQTITATANKISNASFVRVLNNDSGPVLLTQKYANAQVIGTMTIAAGGEAIVNKGATDTLTSNNASNCLGTPVQRF